MALSDDEARARLRYLQLKAKAAAAAPPPAAPEPPGLGRRLADTVVTGASDAISTMMGDTYGREGDPTQRDNLDPRGRLVKAVGGDVLPAVGRATGDVAITAGKAVLPQAAEDAIASGVQTISQSAPVQAVGKGLSQWREASPASYATAGEVANIAAAALPLKGPKLPNARKGAQRLANTMARNRAKEMTHMLEPPDLEGGALSIADDVMATKTFTPGKRLQSVIDEAGGAPGVDPRKSFTHNMRAIDAEVTAVRKALDDKLVDAAPIPAPVVSHAISQAVERTAQSHTLVGDAAKSAERIYAKFDDIIRSKTVDGEITPQALLDTRRELDNWLNNSPGDVFGPGTTASKVATKEIRDTLNTLVDQAAPAAGVKADLGKMHRLLLAAEDLTPKAKGEAKTGLGRYMEMLERTTGLRHPVNPQSMYITSTNPVIGAATGAVALGLGLKRGLGESLAKFTTRMDSLMADAIERGAPAAEKAAILAALNSEKEKRNAAR